MDVSQKDYCSECRVPGTKPSGPKVNLHATKHQVLFSNLTRDILYAIITETPQSVPEHIHQLWSIAIYIPLSPVHRFRPTNAFRLATTSPSPGTNLPIPHLKPWEIDFPCLLIYIFYGVNVYPALYEFLPFRRDVRKRHITISVALSARYLEKWTLW